MGGSVVTANGLMLRAAFPILRDKAIKSLILPKATEDTIKILVSLAYTGRLVILIYDLRHRLQNSCYSNRQLFIPPSYFCPPQLTRFCRPVQL